LILANIILYKDKSEYTIHNLKNKYEIIIKDNLKTAYAMAYYK